MAATRRKLSEVKKDQIVALYLTGLTQEQVASQAGTGNSTISHVLKERRVKARPARRPYKRSLATRQQAVDLYVNDLLTIPETAAALGLGTSTIARWLKAAGVTRPMGDAFALAVQKGRKKWGRCVSIPWQSVKTGRWEFADSRWEVVRMRQLDQDMSVRTWTHLVERIPYTDKYGKRRYYAPDFLIEYIDGRRVVEEVKPARFADSVETTIKATAARYVFSARGLQYKIVTEHEIGREAISSFRIEGLASITDEERQRARRKRVLARRRKNNAPRVNAIRAAWRSRAEAAASRYKAGRTLAEVAEEFCVSIRSIVYWLNKCGVARRAAVMRPHQRCRQGDRMRMRHASASKAQLSLL